MPPCAREFQARWQFQPSLFSRRVAASGNRRNSDKTTAARGTVRCPFFADQWEAPPFGVDRSTTRKTSRSRAARRSRKPRTGSARLPGTAPLHCPAPLHHPVPLRRPVPSCRPALYVCSAISGRQNSFRLSKLKVPTAITSAVNPRRPSSSSNALGTHHNKKSPSEKKIVFRVPRHSQVDCK